VYYLERGFLVALVILTDGQKVGQTEGRKALNWLTPMPPLDDD
jgi:hypothetical protein